jgi:beta-lactam-binding protein with PASTA domain
MPLPEQVERFGLTFDDAVRLRRSLADLALPKEPVPVSEPNQIEVPLLTGLPLREARAKLAAVGLEAGRVVVDDSPSPANSVVGHTPDAGARVDSGSEVSLRVASGLTVRLPEVGGLGLAEASCLIRDAGLRSEPTVEGKSGPDHAVAELDPPAGTLVTPRSAVTIRLKRTSRRQDR